MISQIEFTLLPTNFDRKVQYCKCLTFLFYCCHQNAQSVIFQWVLAIVGVQYDSSIAWHNHLN